MGIEGGQLIQLLLVLAATLLGAKLVGKLAKRIGQPAVLGELLAGVLLGPSLLGLLNPDLPVISLLSELGVIVLLFAIGLETDPSKLIRVGGTASVVAIAGVVLPFFLGFGAAKTFGLGNIASIVVGAAMTATSVGITARVFADLGQLASNESRVVLAAAVLDDVIGLLILGVVTSIIAGTTLSAGGIAKAMIASSSIIIAFVGGLALAGSPKAHSIKTGVSRLAAVVVPIFFVSVGANVDVSTLMNMRVLAFGITLVLLGALGKLLAGYVPFWFRGNRTVIGVGMIPRGEVGLIFAARGLEGGAITATDYAAITLMVFGTTFAAPIALRALLKGTKGTPQSYSSVAEIATDI